MLINAIKLMVYILFWEGNELMWGLLQKNSLGTVNKERNSYPFYWSL